MDLFGIGTTISGLANAGVGLYNTYVQQKENQITREREDNAIQRRVADLKAAGLSPTLAAGSASSAQAMTAPTLNNIDKAFDIPLTIMSLKQGKASINHTNAQTELSKMQATSEQFHQGVMASQKSELDLRNAWIDSDMASKLKLRGLQGDKISGEIGQIAANTALLKAKTAYEQVNKDYLMTAIDNAKIQRDINFLNLQNYGYDKRVEYGSKMPLLMKVPYMSLNNFTLKDSLKGGFDGYWENKK